MDLKRYFLIEKKRLILFQLTLSLIVLFTLMSPAMADEDPEETADPQNPVQFVGPVSDYGLDLDVDGLYDYLVVKFNAQSVAPSTYFFTGDLSVDLGYHESKKVQHFMSFVRLTSQKIPPTWMEIPVRFSSILKAEESARMN